MRRRTIVLSGLGMGLAGSAAVVVPRWLRESPAPQPQGEFVEPSKPPAAQHGAWRAEVSTNYECVPVEDPHHAQLVLYDNAGTVHALDTATGKARWSTPMGMRLRGPIHLIGSRVVVAGSNGTGAVFALDCGSGRRQWRRTVGRQPSITIAGERIVSLDIDGVLTGIDPRNAEVSWRVEPSIEVVMGHLLVSAGDTAVGTYQWRMRDGTAHRLIAVDTGVGEIKWNAESGVRHSFPWLRTTVNGLVHMVRIQSELTVDEAQTQTAQVIAHDLSTGRQVWEFDAHRVGTSPLITDDMIYLTSQPRFLDPTRVHALDARTGQLQWTHKPTPQEAAILDRALFAADQETLLAAAASSGVLALGRRTGMTKWIEPSQDVTFKGHPQIHQGITYLPGEVLAQGGIYRWRVADGRRLETLWPQVVGYRLMIAEGALYLIAGNTIHAMPIPAA